MSDGQKSFFGDEPQTNPSEMDSMSPEVLPTQDPNSDDEQVISENEKEGSDDQEPKRISYTNSEYADMKGDPSMRYEYSSGRAAAGYPSRPHTPQNTDIHEDQTKRADDSVEPERTFYTNSEYANMKGDPKMRYEYSSGRPAAGYPTINTDHNGEPIRKSRRHYKTAGDTFDTGINRSGTSSPWPRSRESTPDRIFYTNSEYANMKGDPKMSYEYSSGRPAAGYPSRPHTPQSMDPTGTSFHPNKMDGDTFDAEINKSGTSSPKPRSKECTPVPPSSTGGQSDDIEPEGQTYSNEEYSDMKGDPSMSYEYSSGRPAAGYPSSPHITPDREIDEDEDEKEGTDEILKPEGISYSNSEYANMKGDPKMSYEYSSGRPAAGCRTSNTSRYNF